MDLAEASRASLWFCTVYSCSRMHNWLLPAAVFAGVTSRAAHHALQFGRGMGSAQLPTSSRSSNPVRGLGCWTWLQRAVFLSWKGVTVHKPAQLLPCERGEEQPLSFSLVKQHAAFY